MSPWAGRPPAGAKVSLLVLLVSVVCSRTGRSERAPVSVSALPAGGCSGACLSRGVTAPWSRCHPTRDGATAGQSPLPSSTVNLQFQKGFFLKAVCFNPRKSRKHSVERVYKGNNATQAAPVCWVALFLCGAVIHPPCQKPKLMMRSSGKRRWPRLCFSLCLC